MKKKVISALGTALSVSAIAVPSMVLTSCSGSSVNNPITMDVMRDKLVKLSSWDVDNVYNYGNQISAPLGNYHYDHFYIEPGGFTPDGSWAICEATILNSSDNRYHFQYNETYYSNLDHYDLDDIFHNFDHQSRLAFYHDDEIINGEMVELEIVFCRRWNDGKFREAFYKAYLLITMIDAK